MKTDTRPTIMILGLGNVLYSDEGLGVHLAERIYKTWDFPDHVEVVDGGTQGHHLLPYVEKADYLLILDAVDFELEPGTIVCCEKEHIPQYLTSLKVSPHQNSFSEILALAQLRGKIPDRITLVGMQPHKLKFGEQLSPLVKDGLEAMMDAALKRLKDWGVEMQPATTHKTLYHPAINEIGIYADM